MLAPYLEIARSKLWSRKGTSSAFAVEKRELQSELALEALCGLKLCLGVVDPNRSGAPARQPGRHICGAAAELDHIGPRHVVGQHPYVGFGHAPDPPRRLITAPTATACVLVVLGSLVPLRAVAHDVVGKLAHDRHRPETLRAGLRGFH